MRQFIAGFAACYLLTGLMIGMSFASVSRGGMFTQGAMTASAVWIVYWPVPVIGNLIDGLSRAAKEAAE
ncbi:hypothetical protein ABNQ39_20675 [Azospirillum sp. A26]|uniref:hypothetical protein n=1 Tax=Azospirillum sp. A26 TaxID=3160607 RepID=UPI00366EA194